MGDPISMVSIQRQSGLCHVMGEPDKIATGDRLDVDGVSPVSWFVSVVGVGPAIDAVDEKDVSHVESALPTAPKR